MGMNKFFNLKNPYQGGAKRVLCLCSAGLLRSPTTAIVLQREYGFNTRAAGVTEDICLIPVTDELCEWADEIVVMEDYMIGCIPPVYRPKAHSLNVLDNFPYMDKKLQKFIKESYDAFLESPALHV